MERLTIDEVIKHEREVAEKKYTEGMLCHANPNDDLLDGCIKCAEEHEQLAKWLEKLKAYEQAEEDGLLIRLPFKIGQKVYYIYTSCIDGSLRIGGMVFGYSCLDFPRTYYATKAEAEQALAKMKGE